MLPFILDCVVKHYPWGSESLLPALLARPNPDSTPWAELWMGTHAGGPSLVRGPDGTTVPLSEFRPRAGGPPVGELPFLFKALAAARPLSIQAHPSLAQAREGFARENAKGIPLDSPARTYKDPNHKPELLCALTPFRALCGYRAPEEPPSDEARALAAELAALYPGDPGADAPLRLNLVTLAPGEAFFVPPGTLHAYLSGLGLEVMACSDNVLRGGLTEKHIDREELARIVNAAPYKPVILKPRAEGPPPFYAYSSPAPEIHFSVLHGGDARQPWPLREDALILVTGGEALFADEAGRRKPLPQGTAAFVPAPAPGERLTMGGAYTLYAAARG
ncbi:MAG: class I mannose-6-phosphate isomerase [Treponema sp.]|jgi:mannose-6-phosphate isomerase|nr:class I mannose-6-phosphate isomerase [Treponema sp.]